MERIGDRLKRIRLALRAAHGGWTQEYVARRYAEMRGEDPAPDKLKRNSQISSWETGRVWPDLETLHTLAAVYNLTFEQLIDGAVITLNDWNARHASKTVQEPAASTAAESFSGSPTKPRRQSEGVRRQRKIVKDRRGASRKN